MSPHASVRIPAAKWGLYSLLERERCPCCVRRSADCRAHPRSRRSTIRRARAPARRAIALGVRLWRSASPRHERGRCRCRHDRSNARRCRIRPRCFRGRTTRQRADRYARSAAHGPTSGDSSRLRRVVMLADCQGSSSVSDPSDVRALPSRLPGLVDDARAAGTSIRSVALRQTEFTKAGVRPRSRRVDEFDRATSSRGRSCRRVLAAQRLGKTPAATSSRGRRRARASLVMTPQSASDDEQTHELYPARSCARDCEPEAPLPAVTRVGANVIGGGGVLRP